MSVVRHESAQQKSSWAFPTGGSAYPTPKSIIHSPPLAIHNQRRYFPAKGQYLFRANNPPPTDRGKPQTRFVHPADRTQPEQTRNYVAPRSFEIISPSGRKQRMVFVERISHITAQIEYGLIPADSQLRRYDEKGCLIGNERMELLSPMVFEDTVRGTFFFAERRPLSPASSPTQAKKGDDKEDKASEKKGEEQDLKRKRSKGKKTNTNGAQDKEKADKDTTAPSSIPTLLEQLVKLHVLKIIPNVRCKSIQHKCACLVRVLLTDSEIAHSCSSPRHPYFLYEAPLYARFKVCTGCRAVPFRRGVYYCSEACLAADWPQHRIECGKTREQLQHIISMLPTILRPRPPAPAHIRVQTHRPLWYRAWMWMGYAAETDKNNAIDLKEWKLRVKSRSSAGCRDLLPGF